MTFFLAIDQSTSATKTLLFDESGSLVDRVSRDHRQIYPHAGWVEHDMEEIWKNTLESLRQLLDRQHERARSIEFLSLTNQRETIVVFDLRTGQPLAPAMVWQCRRGVEICERHLEAGREPMVTNRTGLRIDPYFSASKLQWLVESNSELSQKLDTGEAVIGTVDAYLIHRLTKGRVFATDHTNACRTLLYDIDHLDWSDELCHLWRVPLKALPEIRDSTGDFGETSLEGMLDRPIPIRGVMGDSHASLLAQRCLELGSAKVTFGTGSSILFNIGEKRRHSEKGALTTLAWVHEKRPVYAFEGLIISAASTLTWLRDQLKVLKDVDSVEAIANSIDSSGGVYLIPAFTGLGFPHWKPSARAGIVGLSVESDTRHVIRAGLESISFQLKDALEIMQQEAGLPLRSIHGDGGPTRNAFLMQFTADVTGLSIRVSSVADCSPLGAVIAGRWGSGHFADPDKFTAFPPPSGHYTPRPETAEILNHIEGWHEALGRVTR